MTAFSKCKDLGEKAFFAEVLRKHPEFDTIFKKNLTQKPVIRLDLLQYPDGHSEFLAKEKNNWMKAHNGSGSQNIACSSSPRFEPKS